MPKCRKCGQPAVINMRQHKLSLCAACYPTWMSERVEHTIRHFGMFRRNERVLVAVSGGKDSLALWDILDNLGYSVEGVYVNLGIEHNGYSEVSGQKIAAFAEPRGLRYQVVNLREAFGQSMPDLAMRRRRTAKICSLCGQIKRHLMNRIAADGGFEAIATGHNLDDEAAVLLQNVLHWETSYLRRQAPVLPSTHPRLARKVKPLCMCYEREMAAYAIVRGIDYIYDECPYSVDARSLHLKELLNQMESRSMGAKLAFYNTFLKVRDEGAIQFSDANALHLSECERCGQPTSAAGLCAFCRMWEEPAHPSQAGGDG